MRLVRLRIFASLKRKNWYRANLFCVEGINLSPRSLLARTIYSRKLRINCGVLGEQEVAELGIRVTLGVQRKEVLEADLGRAVKLLAFR